MRAPAFIVAPVFALLITGCGDREPRVLGTAPSEAVSPISAARSARSGASLVVAGEMVEKCPVAGCWFDVRDGSGTIRVDTKNAGFVVLDVPLHGRVTVAGRVKTGGAEPQIDASGVSY
jgi:uncharacterized protein YdeI (BOF family)